MIAGVVKRLRDHGHAVIVEGAEISVGDLIERQAARIAALEAELLATCQREAATHARHDAKIAALEAQVAAADRLAAALGNAKSLRESYNKMPPDNARIGSGPSPKGIARNKWLKALGVAQNKALAAYRAAKGE